MEVDIFPRNISPRVNIITRQEFELAYNDIVIQLVSHYITDSLLS